MRNFHVHAFLHVHAYTSAFDEAGESTCTYLLMYPSSIHLPFNSGQLYHVLFVYLSISLLIDLLIHLSDYLPIFLCIHLSIYLPNWLASGLASWQRISLSTYSSKYTVFRPFYLNISIYPLIYLSINPSICVSDYMVVCHTHSTLAAVLWRLCVCKILSCSILDYFCKRTPLHAWQDVLFRGSICVASCMILCYLCYVRICYVAIFVSVMLHRTFCYYTVVY